MKGKLSAEPNYMLINLTGFRIIKDKNNYFVHFFVLLSLNQRLLHLVKSDEQQLILVKVFDSLNWKCRLCLWRLLSPLLTRDFLSFGGRRTHFFDIG